MFKENPIPNLELKKTALSNQIDKRKVWIKEIGYKDVKVGSSPEAAVKVGETRGMVKHLVEGLSDKLTKVTQELEAYSYLDSLTKLNELVSKGLLTADEVKPHFDKLETFRPLSETNPDFKQALEDFSQFETKPTVSVEVTKSLPTLEIDRNTGNLTIIQGEKVSKTIRLGENKAALQVLLALAENPQQPVSSSTIKDIALKAGSENTTHRADGNIIILRRKFGQTKDTFQFISSEIRGKDSNYTLNADVVFVAEKVNTNPVVETKPKAVEKTTGQTNKEKILIEKIALDKENGTLTINEKTIKLGGLSLAITSYLYDHLNQQIPASELTKILTDAGSKSILGWVVSDVEKSVGGKIFTRTPTGKREGNLWSLETVDNNTESEKDELIPVIDGAARKIKLAEREFAVPVFNKDKKTITVNGKEMELSEPQYIIFNSFAENGNEPISGAVLTEKLEAADFASKARWVISNLEGKRVKKQLFERIGSRADLSYRMYTGQKTTPPDVSQPIRMPLAENVNPGVTAEESLALSKQKAEISAYVKRLSGQLGRNFWKTNALDKKDIPHVISEISLSQIEEYTQNGKIHTTPDRNSYYGTEEIIMLMMLRDNQSLNTEDPDLRRTIKSEITSEVFRNMKNQAK